MVIEDLSAEHCKSVCHLCRVGKIVCCRKLVTISMSKESRDYIVEAQSTHTASVYSFISFLFVKFYHKFINRLTICSSDADVKIM